MRGLIALLAALLLAACQPAPRLLSQQSFVFGTLVEVSIWGAPNDAAQAAINEVLAEFDRLHRSYHAWQPSELMTLNEAIAAGRRIEVAPEMAQLLVAAKALAAQGDYLFDPGIGALVRLWGFHSDNFQAVLPDATQLAALVKARPSIADIDIDGRSVASRNRAVALDFGGYLKGVALDHAMDIMRRHGIANALVNIGGNIMARGAKDGKPWRIGIQSPRAAVPLAALDLLDGEAVGTSGDYQRYFELDGRRYSHLIDPRSGEPARGTQAVTVLVTPRPQAGMWSDVASKPIFMAGAHWRDMAGRLGMTHVMRIDAAGAIETTEAMRPRLTFMTTP